MRGRCANKRVERGERIFLTEEHVGEDVSNAADGEALLRPLAHSEAVPLVNAQHLQNS